MWARITAVLILGITYLSAGQAQPSPPSEPLPPLVDPATPESVRQLTAPSATGAASTAAWQLVFSDEFEDGAIDSQKWQTVYGDLFRQGTPPNAIHRFWRHNNVWEDNGGNLVIRFRRDTSCPEEEGRPDAADHPCYSGGRLDSQGKFSLKYGWLQARIKITEPNGKQSAFWLLPNVQQQLCPGTAAGGGEIDIVEANKQTEQYGTNIHWSQQTPCHGTSWRLVDAPGLHTGYHTFALIWTEDRLEYRYDGQLVRWVDDPDLISDVLQYPILSGAPFAPGFHVDGDIRTATLPAYGWVDWIRIYQQA